VGRALAEPAVTLLAGAEGEQRHALRRMKLIAAGFLLLATVIYAATVHLGAGGWAGYVNTAAEGGMVAGPWPTGSR